MTFEKAQNQIYFSINFNYIYCAFIFQVVLLISHWLEMGSAMMRTTILVASTMVETAVDMTSILITALIVHAISRRLVLLVLIP